MKLMINDNILMSKCTFHDICERFFFKKMLITMNNYLFHFYDYIYNNEADITYTNNRKTYTRKLLTKLRVLS